MPTASRLAQGRDYARELILFVGVPVLVPVRASAQCRAQCCARAEGGMGLKILFVPLHYRTPGE